MEELNRQELEALFREKEPIHKMPFSDKMRIKWNNLGTTIKHLATKSFFRLKMPHLVPALVVPCVVLLVFYIMPNNQKNPSPVIVEVQEPISNVKTGINDVGVNVKYQGLNHLVYVSTSQYLKTKKIDHGNYLADFSINF